MAIKFGFLGANKFWKALKASRILNLSGSMGTGKTLLATALGYMSLWETRTIRVATNYPCVFSEAPEPYRTFAVLDEGALVFDSRLSYKDKNLSKILAQLTFDLRKSGSYLVVPSFITVDRRLRTGVRVWRTFAFSNLLWAYHWELGEENPSDRRPGVNYWDGSLWFFNPSYFFDTYSTHFVPGQELSLAFIRAFMRDEYKVSVSKVQMLNERNK